MKNAFVTVIAIVLSVFLWRSYQQYVSSHHNVDRKRHHKNYHHHDRHHQYQFHPMLGIDESPLGFAREKKPKSYRQLEQEHTTEQTDVPFSTFHVTTLSNGRILPYVGFGVSSQSVDHKEIPIIIQTLLQYASSETEGGGGIAMIDAVIDEDRRLEDGGGSLQYSMTKEAVVQIEEEEEKLESSMAKTVVSLLGRAIAFFGKENSKAHRSGGLQSAKSPSKESNAAPYDYENRLEIHLLLGLSGPDLGIDNTISVLRDIFAELDGLLPPFPKDALNTEPSDWKLEPMLDHHVDVRLHVLLRLSHCENEEPCSSDEATNRELLDRWVRSYTILERLYTAGFIHGIGLDGTHGADILFLLNKCEIKPQLYRGYVSQALDIYGHGLGKYKDRPEHIATILKENNITFLASNVAGHVIGRKDIAPNAYALLQGLGGVVYRAHRDLLNAQGHMPISTGHVGEFYTGEILCAPLVGFCHISMAACPQSCIP